MTKIGSIILPQRIDYNGVGVLRGHAAAGEFFIGRVKKYKLLFHITLHEFVRFIHGLKVFASSSKLF